MGKIVEKLENEKGVFVRHLKTPIGWLIAKADEHYLQSLTFIDAISSSDSQSGKTIPLESIEEELALYFEGKLTQFKTPVILIGTPFQKQVWKELMKIPYGETRSYLDIAKGIGNPLAPRAVGRANGTNKLPIIIPCHRVINADKTLGGYSIGLHRKEWLLDLEGR